MVSVKAGSEGTTIVYIFFLIISNIFVAANSLSHGLPVIVGSSCLPLVLGVGGLDLYMLDLCNDANSND